MHWGRSRNSGRNNLMATYGQSWALDAELISEAEAENTRGRVDDRSYLRGAKLALLKLDG